MKREMLLTSFGLLLISFVGLVSAQYYGGYGRFSLENSLNAIDPSTLILGVVFIISFGLLNFILSKYFKGKNAIAAIIALSLSLFIIWGLNRSGIDYNNLFYGFFFFIPNLEGLLYNLGSGFFVVIFILLVIWGIMKKTLKPLFIFGGLLIVLGSIAPYGGSLIGSGIVILVIGTILWIVFNRNRPRLGAWGRPIGPGTL